MPQKGIEQDAVIEITMKIKDPITGEVLEETTATSKGSFKTLTYDDLGDLDRFYDKFDDFEKETLKTVAKAQSEIAGGFSRPGEKKRRG